MTRGEYRAALKLYRAAGAVLSIAGYRWSREQIDGARELLTEAGLELFPYLEKASRTRGERAEEGAA